MKNMKMDNWSLISIYTTKQAVADGVLIRVDDSLSQQAGIRYPVYLSLVVFSKYVQVPSGYEDEQNSTGRLCDILNTFIYAAKRCSNSFLEYHFITHTPDADNWEQNEVFTGGDRTYRLVRLKATIEGQDFDDPSPAIFILKPQED